MQKPSRRVFLLAAELMFEAKEENAFVHYSQSYSPYSCDNLACAAHRLNRSSHHLSEERLFYTKMFKPENTTSMGWWPELDNGEWDYESRIYALLFAAEMLRRPKRSKTKGNKIFF